MKKIIVVLVLSGMALNVKAQSDEIQQLILNVAKLSELKKILQNMYDGYKILYKGYSAVKDISKGNFNLHKTFLDGLLQVSSGVRKYKRVADIIDYQVRTVKEYKAAFKQFKNDRQFTSAEIDYIDKIYRDVFDRCINVLDDLAMVITAGKLRMSDDERLQAIDRIFNSVEDQYAFLKDFNGNTAMLSLQRKHEQTDIKLSKRVYGLK